MSDDVKGSEEQKQPAEAGAGEKQTKTYSEEQFKELVAQRDDLKKRLRTFDEAEAKRKAEADSSANQKAIEEGKAKETLKKLEDGLKSADDKIKTYEEQLAKLRETLVSKLTDAVDHEVATKIPDLDTLTKFVEARTQAADGPAGGKGQLARHDFDIRNFKGSQQELEAFLRKEGRIQ